MIVYIVGAKREVGNYQGRDYDNVKIRVTFPAAGETVEKGIEFGDRVAEYKVKSSILPIEKVYDLFKSKTPCEIYFDQYGGVALVNPVKK